jgi:hypothetical protein
MKLYAFLRDGEYKYISDNLELLQEFCMDEYFDAAYQDWLAHNFILPEKFKKLNIGQPADFEYVTPEEWWTTWNEPFGDWRLDLIDLGGLWIE